MKNVLLFLVLSSFVFAKYSNENIANELRAVSAQNNIDKRVLYTIAKIESNFTPLIISFTSKDTNFSFKGLKKKVSAYGNKFLISFQGKEEDLQRALKILIKQGIKVDAGIMQINSVNFKESEIEHIFNPAFNIQKSAHILKQCQNAKSTLKHSIECYNKGLRKVSKFNYYEKFKKSFLKDFGGVK